MLAGKALQIGSGVLLLLHVGMLVVVGAAAWWLSGFDSRLTGEDPARDLVRRLLRCAGTLVLIGVAFNCLVRWYLYGDRTSGFAYILLALPVGVGWAGCLSEVFARCFQYLVNPEDSCPADLGEDTRALDQLGRLVQAGRKDEAIQLCQKLRESGRASGLALDAMLSRLGVEPSTGSGAPPGSLKVLQEADRLRAQGQFDEAEAQLKALLKQEPSNQSAALMLMRLYAQDLRRPDQAGAVLRAIAQQRFIPPAFIEYAQRSLSEWSQPRLRPVIPQAPAPVLMSEPAAPAPAAPLIEPTGLSVDQLLAEGYLGSAIELMEKELQQRPNDFELWMKLAEAQGVRCGNLGRANKIIERLAANPAFTPEQIQEARAKLKEWKSAASGP